MADQSKLRKSRPRQIVLDAVGRLGHPDAEGVFEEARKILPRISLGTVYRNLETLTRHGQVHRLVQVGTRTHYDATPSDHCHIQCTGCGCVEDVNIDLESVWAAVEELVEAHAFQLTGHSLKLSGICPKCRDMQAKK